MACAGMSSCWCACLGTGHIILVHVLVRQMRSDGLLRFMGMEDVYFDHCSIIMKRSRNASALKSPNPLQSLVGDDSSDDDNSAPQSRLPTASTPSASLNASNRTPSASPGRSAPDMNGQCVASPVPSASPGGNRASFLQKFSPSRAVCNMDLCRALPGTKVSICGVVTAVFPAATNPDRRYIQIADATGSVGITVWNDNVSRFTRDSIGQVVVANRIVCGSHHGKKVLTMTRESSLDFPSDHPLKQWWSGLLSVPPPSLAAIQDTVDNTIVNVSGVLGMTTEEVKMVGGTEKVLTTLHLGDPSGELLVKSWNHKAADFSRYLETPVLVQRVRVSSFAGQKSAEFLDNSGSVVVTEFPGKEVLSRYWID